MKKLLLITFALLGLVNAQNGFHIHHLFGLKESTPGLFTQSALNQQDGHEVEIETFNLSINFGGPYGYYTVNNTVLYLDSINQTIGLVNQYDLPEFFESGYTGTANSYTLQGIIAEICVNPLVDSVMYGFDFQQKVLSANVYAAGFGIGTSASMTNLTDLASLNMVYFNGNIYVSGKTASNQVTIYVVNETSLAIQDTLNFTAESMYLVANPLMGIFGIAQDTQQQNSLIQLNTATGQVVTLGALPSCFNCATDVYEYDKNAVVLDPENNQIILSRSESLGGNVSHYLSTYELQNGTEIYNVPTAERWSNLIFQKPQADLVYPGDANHDKVVDMLDVLPIGLKYNDNVQQRFEISSEWIGQFAVNSGDTFVGGLDKKHADCNGDGQINSVDIDAINDNYDFIHYSEKGTNASCDFPLYVNFPSLVKEDEAIEISIGLDLSANPFQDVYGVVFTVEFDSNFIVQNTLNTAAINGGWFGTENSDYLQINQVDFPQGKMDVGVVGIDKLNRNGGGVLLNGIWTMEDVVIPIAQGYLDMPMRITNVTIIDFDENEIDACGVDTIMRVYDKNVGIKNRPMALLDIHPNPTRSSAINLGHIENLGHVEIYDLQGRLLQTCTNNFGSINIGEYNKGVYIVKAYAGETVYVNKLVFDKE